MASAEAPGEGGAATASNSDLSPNEYSFNLSPDWELRNYTHHIRAIFPLLGKDRPPTDHPPQSRSLSDWVCSWDNDDTLRNVPRRDSDLNERRVFMKRLLTVVVLVGLLVPSMRAAEKPADNPPPAVKVGDMAPDFTLTDQNNNKVSLHDFKGKKNVALAFYIFAFTGG